MEISGKIIEILPVQIVKSAKGEWKKQEFILETLAQYPKKICITNWNEKLNIVADKAKTVKVFVDIESREYNGRWFTEVKAWKIEQDDNFTGSGSLENFNAPRPVEDEEGDDLPF